MIPSNKYVMNWITYCGVILNCRGIYKQTKGYEFKYYEEENISI